MALGYRAIHQEDRPGIHRNGKQCGRIPQSENPDARPDDIEIDLSHCPALNKTSRNGCEQHGKNDRVADRPNLDVEEMRTADPEQHKRYQGRPNVILPHEILTL